MPSLDRSEMEGYEECEKEVETKVSESDWWGVRVGKNYSCNG